jgi:hypothetical protein
LLGVGCTPLLLEAAPDTETGGTEEEDAEFFIEEDETILPSLDPFDFADAPLRVTLLLLRATEEDDSSSFTDVLLSSPQAVRVMVRATTAMTPVRPQRLLPGCNFNNKLFIEPLIFQLYTTD